MINVTCLSGRNRRLRVLFTSAAMLTLLCGLPKSAASGGESAKTAPGFIVAGMRVLPKKWDKQHNYALLVRYAEQAARRGARLVVTCEGFLDGYTGNTNHNPGLTRERYLRIGEPIDGPWLTKVGELASRLRVHIAVGFSERRGNQMYNSVAVFSDAGQRVHHYSKTHTTGEAFNTPGNDFPVTGMDIGTIGTLICYDRMFPEVPRILALKGAQILIVPAYGTDRERNEALLRTRAWENSTWVVYVKQNRVLIIDPRGEIVARDGGCGDELVIARIELNDDVGTGEILRRRSPELYREIIEISRPMDP